MKSVYYSVIALLTFGLIASYAIGNEINGKYKTEKLNEFSFPIKLPVEDLVDILRFRLGIRVHFENEQLDYKSDGLSADKIVETYKSIPIASMSPFERNRFLKAQQFVQSGSGKLIMDYKRQFVNLNMEDLHDVSKLIKKIEETNVFCVKISNGSIIIYPHNVNYENIVRFHRKFKSLDEAFANLSKELLSRNLILEINGGRFNKAELNFDIDNEDFRIFLAKFAEAIGQDIVWNIGGYAGGRHITFLKIKNEE